MRCKKRNEDFRLGQWFGFGACPKDLAPLVILTDDYVEHNKYIKAVLPLVKKYGNKVFGDNWIFQQNNAMSHTHHWTQKWCNEDLSPFNVGVLSLHFNPLGYCM